MYSTIYRQTFIRVADDCPVDAAQVPPAGRTSPSIAWLQYHLITEHPYTYTSDDVLFEVHVRRAGIPPGRQEAERAAFFATPRACLRASPLAKRYGWGIHHDAEGKVALVPLGTEEYRRMANDPSLRQFTAMRSTRARSGVRARGRDAGVSLGEVAGESSDEVPGLGRIEDLDVVGELEELAYSVELVVADGDAHPPVDRLDATEATAEDASGDVHGVDVEQRGDPNGVLVLHLGDQPGGYLLECDVRPEAPALLERNPRVQPRHGEHARTSVSIRDQVPAATPQVQAIRIDDVLPRIGPTAGSVADPQAPAAPQVAKEVRHRLVNVLRGEPSAGVDGDDLTQRQQAAVPVDERGLDARRELLAGAARGGLQSQLTDPRHVHPDQLEHLRLTPGEAVHVDLRSRRERDAAVAPSLGEHRHVRAGQRRDITEDRPRRDAELLG